MNHTQIPKNFLEAIAEWSTTQIKTPVLITTFGSFRLNGNIDNSDIDILLIIPHHERHFLFHSLTQFLQTKPSQFHNVVCVSSAFVPVIKFHVGNFDIDLVMCCVHGDSVNHEIPIHQYTLIAKQEEDLRSLQGAIATETILQYVENPDFFSRALRAVKLWAVRRNIYSNQLGLLNGVALAIMTAYVLQAIPPPPPNTIPEYYYFTNFIRIFRTYNWLSGGYVSLNPQVEIPSKRQLMCVFTPLDPPLNCMYNTGYHQYRMIMSEFELAEKNNFQVIPTFPSFFSSEESNYLLISVFSAKEELQSFKLFVESKLKYLGQQLPQDCTFVYCTKCWRVNPSHVIYIAKCQNVNITLVQNLLIKFIHESTPSNSTTGRFNLDVVKSNLLPPFVLNN